MTTIVFFLKERPQDYAPFLLVKKEFISKRSQRSEYRLGKRNNYKKIYEQTQAPLINEERRFAPVSPQARASSLILISKDVADCSFRWNIRALRL